MDAFLAGLACSLGWAVGRVCSIVMGRHAIDQSVLSTGLCRQRAVGEGGGGTQSQFEAVSIGFSLEGMTMVSG